MLTQEMNALLQRMDGTKKAAEAAAAEAATAEYTYHHAALTRLGHVEALAVLDAGRRRQLSCV